MSWILFSLLTLILWGVGNIFIKKGYADISTLWTVVISATINLLVYFPFALINGVSFSISPADLLAVFVITSFYIFFFYAIEKGQISFSGTIFATYPVTTIILSAIFLRESISFLQILFITIILLGTFFLSVFSKQTSGKNEKRISWILWAVVGAVTTGAADFLAKIKIDEIGINTFNFLYPLLYFVSFGVFWIIDKKGRKPPKKINIGQFKYTVVGITMLTCGLLSFNYALSLGKASLVAPLSSGYVAVTVLLAYYFLKDSITKKQLLALLLIFVGIVGVSL